MQKINLILKYFVFSFVILALASCEKDYPGDSYDFSASVAPFVELAAKTTATVKQGANHTSVVQIRTAFQEDLTVGYQITGDYTASGTVVLPRNSRTVNLVIAIPAGLVVDPAVSISSVLKIVSATRASGEPVIIGRLGADLEKRNLTITK